ncbi:MAG: NAD(P)/FAD-dependent oxidoreductase [Vicinamibacterales bacterium]
MSTPSTDIDVAVIGAGVVGLASAREIAIRGRSVCVIEAHPRPGMEASTHNSGVIHAGLYHPADSLKTTLAIEGRERLYAFCEQYGVPHRRTGKLIIAASPDESPALLALAERARRNGVRDIEIVDAAAVRRLEPLVHAHTAMYSPSTGILEAETYIRMLERHCRECDVALLYSTRLAAAEARDDAVQLRTGREAIRAACVVNAAGLFADEVSHLFGRDAYRIYPCRGEYAELLSRWTGTISRPVYPLPHASGHGLGVHLTPVIGGPIMLGPTIRYQDDKRDYERDRLPLEFFLDSTKPLLPSIGRDDVRLGGSGIRAKLHPPTESFADFLIERDAVVPRLVHAAGIDSPGLTASLAIARRVADLVEETV